MLEYRLPRTESGVVDLEEVIRDFDAVFTTHKGRTLILKAIDANARKDEREACAKKCKEVALGWDGVSSVAAHTLANVIRNMRGEK